MIIVALLISLIVFLFFLFVLSRDDFVFVRKNISQEKIFNLGFICIGSGLFASRLVYVLTHFDTLFLNPLVFVAFSHIPGLSLEGGFLGGCLVLGYYGIYRKLPVGRLFDMFVIASFFALAIGMISMEVYKVLSKQETLSFVMLLPLLYLLLVSFSTKWYTKASLREGNVTSLLFFSYGIISLSRRLFQGSSIASMENILYAALSIGALVLFFYSDTLPLKKSAK